ncbi:MAG: methylmalonyl-CoA mutase family protein [Actinobacteria bacterium]|nr:methylmalonyl-CoA mutase family protein [Actinomycetota bacterium]
MSRIVPATLGAMTDVPSHRTDSGIELGLVYAPEDLDTFDPDRDLGRPGEVPFTRGVYPTMYLGKLWTMRQYAGMATAEETNRRFRYLLEHGQTGLSVAFDLPTQMGLDSDHPRAEGEVGKTGVAIDSIEDMARLFDEIPLERASTSMTINATAPILLLLYELVAEERGIDSSTLSGTVQNDLLKEYAARGTYIYPPKPSMRLITDVFAYCGERIPRWNTISVSGYHMREAGATAVQEVAFTLANGIAYVQAAIDAGLVVDEFAPRVSFFFACHMNFFEEIAKFRAARRMWARIMSERFGTIDPKSRMLRFHTQTGGATLTAQQPENNIVRTALEALAAVLGGTQSLHTNSFDEALALPTEQAAKTALRTQQVLGHETGVTHTVDPLGGSYYLEALTNEVEAGALAYIDRIDRMGGAVSAIEAGFYQDEIHEAAYRVQQGVESGERVVVGVNRFEDPEEHGLELQRIAEEDVARQVERVRNLRSSRDRAAVDRTLADVEAVARGTGNLLPPMKEALRVRATLGEVSDVLRAVFGEYRPG